MEASELHPRPTLAAMRNGEVCRVVATLDGDTAALARVGLVAGTRVELESRAPFGGPLVVRVGRSRVAVPRAIGLRIRVEVLP